MIDVGKSDSFLFKKKFLHSIRSEKAVFFGELLFGFCYGTKWKQMAQNYDPFDT